MKPSPNTPLLRTLAAAGVLALTLSAGAALAQTDDKTGAKADGGSAPQAATDATVPGVTVRGERPPVKPPIPADKKAAYDAEAAKAEAWQKYRKSTPPASASTIDQAKDYPGLQSLLPQPEGSTEGR